MKEYYIHIFKNNSVLLSNLPEELREEGDRCSCNLTNSMLSYSTRNETSE